MTAQNGGLVSGVANTTSGALVLYSDQDIYSAGILPAATPTGAFVWRLPPAACGGSNYFLNIDADGTGGCTDPASLADGTGTDDQTASEVVFTPNGSIAATDVQTAIQEVRDEAGSGHTEVTLSADLGNNLLGLSYTGYLT